MVNAVQVYTKIFGAALVKSWCSPSEIMVQPSEIKVQPMKSWFGHCRSYSTITYIELFCAHIIIYFVLATIMLHFSLIVHNDKFHSKHIQQLEATTLEKFRMMVKKVCQKSYHQYNTAYLFDCLIKFAYCIDGVSIGAYLKTREKIFKSCFLCYFKQSDFG